MKCFSGNLRDQSSQTPFKNYSETESSSLDWHDIDVMRQGDTLGQLDQLLVSSPMENCIN